MAKCPVPGCELLAPHVPYVTDFCHACGGTVGPAHLGGGKICDECGLWFHSEYCTNVIPFVRPEPPEPQISEAEMAAWRAVTKEWSESVKQMITPRHYAQDRKRP